MKECAKCNEKENYESIEAKVQKLQECISYLERNIIEGNQISSVMEKMKESSNMHAHYSALQNYFKNQLKGKKLGLFCTY